MCVASCFGSVVSWPYACSSLSLSFLVTIAYLLMPEVKHFPSSGQALPVCGCIPVPRCLFFKFSPCVPLLWLVTIMFCVAHATVAYFDCISVEIFVQIVFGGKGNTCLVVLGVSHLCLFLRVY